MPIALLRVGSAAISTLGSHAGKIAASGVFAYGDHLWHALDEARPPELEGTEFRQLQQLIFSVEVLLYVTLIQLPTDSVPIGSGGVS
jgi:hypothetical protein